MALSPTPSKPRLTYLDLTKGFLVLLMVVYHSLNYTRQYQLAFLYLSFLPSSFILITGFLLSRVYAPRYVPGDRSLMIRLFLRGFRLLLLFTGLNLIAQFVRSPAYGHSVGVAAFFQNWSDIYLFGSSRLAAFDVRLGGCGLGRQRLVDDPAEHSADDRREPEDPELLKRESADDDRRTGAARWVHGRVRHRDRDQVDERETEADGDRSEGRSA